MTLHTANNARMHFDPDTTIIRTVIESYYSRGVAAADRARRRAERGYTIAGAVAAALVATGLLADLSRRPTLVQVLVLGAVGVWLGTVMLFIWAVAVDVRTPDTEALNGAGWTNGCEFVRSVSEDIQDELSALHRRQLAALTATAIALILTISALVAGTLDPARVTREEARIALTAEADGALRQVCGSEVRDIYATVDPANLATDVVTLQLPAGECGDTVATIREPRTTILTERQIRRFPRSTRQRAAGS